MKKGNKKKPKKEKPILFRFDPKVRMANALDVDTTEKYTTLPFSKKRIDSSTPFKSTEARRQIYPTGMTCQTDIKFTWKFECGNLDSVYVRGQNAYEIHLKSDPGRTAQWYLFKCENVLPGDYTFVITGFSRDTGIHHHGITPVALSMNELKNGLSWMRFGNNVNYWKSVSGNPPEYTISFQFTVNEPDTMYFAYTYPYTLTRLNKFFSTLPHFVGVCRPGKTTGDMQIPIIFWDADNGQYKAITSKTIMPGRKPMVIITARHHPGETCSSFAMEGFIEYIISEETRALWLKEKFSFLIIPMMNIDGVVCGFYRPGLGGTDMNRVWKKLVKPEAKTITNIVDKLSETRRIMLFLDFHGHAGQWNAFTYGVMNKKVPLNEFQKSFMEIMAAESPYFDLKGCASLGPKAYDRTMRVAYHNRYQIPFSYTLEMSIGGSDLIKPYKQFTPNEYREIGASTCIGIYKLFFETPNVIRGINVIEARPKSRTQTRPLTPKRSQSPSARLILRSMTPRMSMPKKTIPPQSAHSAANSEDSESI